ncbi:phosphoribosylaminoimidazole carboxylase, PurK protein [Rubidibacter lacunae KORDI 51-2]|uniref:N5-carboxyaminoimidazole ribonucleotide synthase n=1 Tax=Rubidibacter lacunae KORDI 51-2 TaxID=582515 RepID=U5DDZ8_9CHRO|nr:5-(carboxyamino)imidazole ribonucleotide synthase [Rubidibacter lacunae]ERN42733.1 phosphoribosylaminoimidazole carboxylase, PurK protein [Rubidibacter lacunae KORDI 51-2]
MTIKRIGVIGGGQLAWMLAGEAPKLGIELVVQAASRNDPAVARAAKVLYGAPDDAVATAELARYCDAIAFENELVDLPALRGLEAAGVCFRPGLDSLAPLLDKYYQRRCLLAAGLPVPDFEAIAPDRPLDPNWTLPLVLKTRRHGYDGRGTFIFSDPSDLKTFWQRPDRPALLREAYVPFECELAIVAARNAAGDIATFPITETRQVAQVCRWAIAPAPVSTAVSDRAREIARTLLQSLDIVGIVAIEFFLDAGDRLLVNEIAPRTHNSGHYTLDACYTSQFALQLQAVAELPLGATALHCDGAVMVNLLGYEHADRDYRDKRRRLEDLPGASVHWYGKTARPGRKLGHATLLLDRYDYETARALADRAWEIWVE